MLLRIRNLLRTSVAVVLLGCFISPSSGAQERDAITLTLRLQQGIHLDTSLLSQVEKALAAARAVDDTLLTIGAFPDYVPDQLILSTGAAWATAWEQGVLTTGNAAVDSINAEYGAVSVAPVVQGWNWYVITFSKPMRIDLLAGEYSRIPELWFPEPNGYMGDGDRIELFRKNGLRHFAFSKGWGDCPAGCAHRSFWYITVDGAFAAKLEGALPDPYRLPITHRWNIPARYPATAFAGADALAASFMHGDWWVRRHALTVAGRLVNAKNPWVGEDFQPKGLFESLKAEVLSRRIELADKAFERTADEDADVAEAALRAHQLLRGQGAPHSHYYPLGTGSAWHFTGNNNQLLETVVGDETDSLGVTRFRFSRLRWMENVSLRFSGDDKVYLSKNGGETLWLDFGAKVGQEWTASDPESPSAQLRVRLESVSDSVKVPAGTFRNAYRFSFFAGLDNEWVEWYAPFVGPVKKHFNGIAFWEYNLASYSIQTEAPPPESALPQSARLMQNYPNPVTGRTIIPFRVAAAAAHVRIAVHDLLGREVMILLDEECSSGVNNVAFDAGGLPGGTYAVRLQSGGFSMLRLVTIVK